MSIATRIRPLGRAGLVIGGLVTAAALAGTAAYADTNTYQLLPPGQSACASQNANYQVRLEGTASKAGVKFRVYRNGVLVAASPSDTSSGYATELRSAWGNFPGAGVYTICALNKQTTNSFVSLRVRSDGEI
jgi:phage tail sheath gpL-like